MELPVLANPKRNVLRGIASRTERPSKNKAERSEAKTPGAGFPRPKGQAVENGGAGTTPPETAAAAKCPTERYVKYPPPRSEATSDDGRRTTVRKRAIWHNVQLDGERRVNTSAG